MIKTIIIALFLGIVGTVSAQKNIVVDTIQSSTICETCKKTLEDGLRFEKGIVRVTVDYQHQQIIVKYQNSKTNKEQIKKAIVGLGYSADELLADPEAFKQLPACCKSKENHH